MKELNILGTSILNFTRLPLPFKVAYSKEAMGLSLTWFPVVGFIVGLIGAAAWWCFNLILPSEVALALSMVATILATGAFHEDGLGDICDGFGGGYTTEKKLSIMKDSCIGAYGAIGIVMMLLTKYVVLSHLPAEYLFVGIVLAHSLSRSSVIIITQIWKYVRLDDSSKARSASQKQPIFRFVFAMITGALPLLFFPFSMAYIIVLVGVVMALMMGLFYKKQIGGYTGDCLGAAQQVIEVSIYLSILAFA